MDRMTRYICDRAHGAEGVSSENLTGVYCRGQFEATALVERLALIEDILGDGYDLDHLRELLEACKGLEPSEIAESKLLIATRKDPEKLARMAELVEADREGQCVVLPKDGMVYYIEEAGGEKWVANKPIQQIIVRCGWGLASLEFSLLDAGKYFTREAAEAALKGAQNGR